MMRFFSFYITVLHMRLKHDRGFAWGRWEVVPSLRPAICSVQRVENAGLRAMAA